MKKYLLSLIGPIIAFFVMYWLAFAIGVFWFPESDRLWFVATLIMSITSALLSLTAYALIASVYVLGFKSHRLISENIFYLRLAGFIANGTIWYIVSSILAARYSFQVAGGPDSFIFYFFANLVTTITVIISAGTHLVEKKIDLSIIFFGFPEEDNELLTTFSEDSLVVSSVSELQNILKKFNTKSITAYCLTVEQMEKLLKDTRHLDVAIMHLYDKNKAGTMLPVTQLDLWEKEHEVFQNEYQEFKEKVF